MYSGSHGTHNRGRPHHRARGVNCPPPGIVRVLKSFRVKTLDLPPVLQWPPRPPRRQPWSFFQSLLLAWGLLSVFSDYTCIRHSLLTPGPSIRLALPLGPLLNITVTLTRLFRDWLLPQPASACVNMLCLCRSGRRGAGSSHRSQVRGVQWPRRQ